MQNAWRPISESEKEPFAPIVSPEDRTVVGTAIVRLVARMGEIQITVTKNCWAQNSALSKTQLRIFLFIATGDGPTQSELAGLCGVHQTTASRVVKVLVEDDWIKAIPSVGRGKKGHSSRWKPTGKGKKMLAAWYAAIGEQAIADRGSWLPSLERISKMLLPPKSRQRSSPVAPGQQFLDL